MEELLYEIEHLLKDVDSSWIKLILYLAFWLISWVISIKTYFWWKNRNPLSDLAQLILAHLNHMHTKGLLSYDGSSPRILRADPLIIFCSSPIAIRIKLKEDFSYEFLPGLTKREIKKICKRAYTYLCELEKKDSRKREELIKSALLPVQPVRVFWK